MYLHVDKPYCTNKIPNNGHNQVYDIFMYFHLEMYEEKIREIIFVAEHFW